MIALVDTHCHLLAGMDDGPKTSADALEMCRQAYGDGTRCIAATCHQSEHYPAVNAEAIRGAVELLATELRQADIPLTVCPSAEIMAAPDMVEKARDGTLMTVGDKAQFLLVEMPHRAFVDLTATVRELRNHGIRVILAHAERYPEFLHESGRVETLIAEGCLVQASTRSVTHPRNNRDLAALKRWFKRGVVHLLGSDGHSPRTRQPLMAQAYRTIAEWTGLVEADRIASTNALAVLQGLSLQVPPPEPESRRWFFW